MKSTQLILCLASALAWGCASAPLATDAESYLPLLSSYVVGVWNLENEITHIPRFLESSSADTFEAKFNPTGYHPRRETKPERLQLIVLPGHAFIDRFENAIPPEGELSGYLLVRTEVGGETKSFLRRYVLTGRNRGAATLEVRGARYALRVGPEVGGLRLVYDGPFPDETEPSLTLRKVGSLPDYSPGEITSLEQPPLFWQPDGLPAGVKAVE